MAERSISAAGALEREDSGRRQTRLCQKDEDAAAANAPINDARSGHRDGRTQAVRKDTKIQVYFAHPHSPWERGTNENTMVCYGNSFRKEQTSEVSDIRSDVSMNGRPRKVNWKTPYVQELLQ